MQLAAMLATVAQRGAEIKSLGPMCGDCAFKCQPDINGYSEAVNEAAGLLVTGGMFHCHTDDYKDKGTPCKGFLYAQQYFAKLDTQTDGKTDQCPRQEGPVAIEGARFSEDPPPVKAGP